MGKIKSVQVRYDQDMYGSAASSLNDYIFCCFPVGWFAGLVAGTVYAGFHWDNLQFEFGRILLLTVTVALGVTYWLSCLVVCRVLGNK